MKLGFKNKLNLNKRVVITTLLVLALAIAGLFAYSEYSASKYVERSKAAYQDAKNDMHAQLSADSLTVESLTGVGNMAFQSADKLCDEPFLAKWRLDSEHRVECETRLVRLNQVDTQADELVRYIQDDRIVADIFDEASTKLAKVTEGDYKARQQIWRQVEKQLPEVSIGQNHRALVDQLESSARQLVDRYDKLITANDSEKRSQFDDAVADLQEAYEDLGESRSKSREAYQKQADAFLDTIVRLSN